MKEFLRKTTLLLFIIIVSYNGCSDDVSEIDFSGNEIKSPAFFEAVLTKSNEVTFQWEDISYNENGFIIERKIGDGEFNKIVELQPESMEFTDSNIDPEKTYYYRIYSFNNDYRSQYSDVVIVRTPANAPESPSDIFSPKSSSSTIILQWVDNSDNEEGFRIERSSDGKKFKIISETSDNMTAFLDSGLRPGVRYYYKIWSFNSGGLCEEPAEVNVTTLPLTKLSNLKKWVNKNYDVVNVNIEGKTNSNGLYSLWQFTEKIDNIYDLDPEKLDINTYKSYKAYYLFDEDRFFKLYGQKSMPVFIHPFDESGSIYSYDDETGDFFSAGAQILNGRIKILEDTARVLFYNNKIGNYHWEYMTLEKIGSLSGVVMGRDQSFTAQDLFFFTAEFESSDGGRSESDAGELEIYIVPDDGVIISRQNPIVAALFQWGEYDNYEVITFGATASEKEPIILKRIPDGSYWVCVYQKNNIMSQNFNLENNENHMIYNGFHFDKSQQIINSKNLRSNPEPITINYGHSKNITIPFSSKYRFFSQSGIEEAEKQITSIRPSLTLIDDSIAVQVEININDEFKISNIEGVQVTLSSERSYTRGGTMANGKGQLIQMELDDAEYDRTYNGFYTIAGYEESGNWKLSEINIIVKDLDENYIEISYTTENFGNIFPNYIYKERRANVEYFPQVIKRIVKAPTVEIPTSLVPDEDLLSPELLEIGLEIHEPGNSFKDRLFNNNDESIIFSVHADDITNGNSGLRYCKLYFLSRDNNEMNDYVVAYLDRVDGNKIIGNLYHEVDSLNAEYDPGAYDLVMIDIIDNAGNSIRYSIYDNEVYDVVDLNFLGLNENYCGYNFEKNPAISKTKIPLVTIFKH